MAESDPYPVPLVHDARHRVAEQRLDLPLQGLVDHGRQVGAPKACEVAVGQAAERVTEKPPRWRPCRSTKSTSLTR